MQRDFLRIVSWAVLLLAAALLVVHLSGWTRLTVDNTVLILLGIILISPLIEKLRKIKIGNFFEAEIASAEVEKVRSDVEKGLGVSAAREQMTTLPAPLREDLLDLFEKDHVLALAKLRMELEQILVRIHRLTDRPDRSRVPRGLSRILRDLVQWGKIPTKLSHALQEVISLGNRAIHGERVRDVDARTILDIGIRILEELQPILVESLLKPAQVDALSPEVLGRYMDAKYRVTTVVPLVENPVRSIRVLDQEGLNALLEGYDEYAEFLVGIEKVEQS